MADADLPFWPVAAVSGLPGRGDLGRVSGTGGDFTTMTWSVPGGMVLSLGGELDVATAPLVTGRVRELVEQGHSRIVLDLAHLEFCDCSGLGALLRAQKITAGAGGWARLSRVPGMTRRIAEITGLREALVCYDSAAEALAAG